jgi:hypothetical protein
MVFLLRVTKLRETADSGVAPGTAELNLRTENGIPWLEAVMAYSESIVA